MTKCQQTQIISLRLYKNIQKPLFQYINKNISEELKKSFECEHLDVNQLQEFRQFIVHKKEEKQTQNDIEPLQIYEQDECLQIIDSEEENFYLCFFLDYCNINYLGMFQEQFPKNLASELFYEIKTHLQEMPEIETQGDFQIQQYASIFMPRLLNKFQDKYSAIQSQKQENQQQNQFLNNINVAIDFQIFKKISSSSFKSQYNSDEPTNYYDTTRSPTLLNNNISINQTISQLKQSFVKQQNNNQALNSYTSNNNQNINLNEQQNQLNKSLQHHKNTTNFHNYSLVSQSFIQGGTANSKQVVQIQKIEQKQIISQQVEQNNQIQIIVEDESSIQNIEESKNNTSNQKEQTDIQQKQTENNKLDHITITFPEISKNNKKQNRNFLNTSYGEQQQQQQKNNSENNSKLFNLSNNFSTFNNINNNNNSISNNKNVVKSQNSQNTYFSQQIKKQHEKDEEIQHQETIRQVSQVDQLKQAHQNEKKYSSYRCWAFFGLVLAFIFFAILFSVLFS